MLIPLGYHCNITFLNQAIHVKKETGVFEWFESKNLQNITDVINTLTNNPTQNVVFCESSRHVYLLCTDFFSGHYHIDEYKMIFQRRYNRFIDIINKEEHLYFVRINPLGVNTNKHEVELFIESIKRMNPNNKITFLLISTIHNDGDINSITIDINNVSFYHKYFYEKDVNDVYLRNPTIIYENYKKMLEDIGYNINDTANINFEDISAF
jgi:hypothetical protein